MKDSDLRGLILQRLYDARNEPGGYLRVNDLRELTDGNVNHIANVCAQLQQLNLIEWKDARGPAGPAGIGKITVHGVDVIEGNVRPPMAITIYDHRTTITDSSNVQVGKGNVQHITINDSEILEAIDQSEATSEQKADAKFHWSKLTNNAAFAAIIGAVVTLAGSAH